MADQISTVKEFYESLQTVPKLIRDLALGIAEAQRGLDHDYLINLAEFTRVIRAAVAPTDGTAVPNADYLALFRSMAPSRYQFTETVAEVRADLQMANSSEIGVDAKVGITGALFAVSVNASYSRRTASNAEASAMIKTVMHAIPADPGVMEKLVARAAAAPTTQMPSDERWKVIAGAFQDLFKAVPPASTPAKITSIDTKTVPAGTADTVVTITGSGFAKEMKGVWTDSAGKATDLATEFTSETQVKVTVTKALLATKGSAKISLKLDQPCSNTVDFTIT